MKNKYTLFLICIFTHQLICTSIFAQTKQIDSLLTLLKTDKRDTNKVNHLNDLCWEYNSIGNYDTALTLGKQAIVLGEKLDFKKGIAASYNIIGLVYNYQGNYQEAFKNHFASLKINETIGDKNGIANSYNFIGYVYDNQGNYPEAVKNYFTSLKIKETIGDKKGMAYSYGNIGNVNNDQGNYPEALKNFYATLKLLEDIGDKEGIANSYNSIGNVYYYQGNYPEALKNHFASLKILETIGDKRGIAISYNNIGSIYNYQGNYPEALKNHFTSLKIREAIGDNKGIASSYNNIGIVYNSQGNYPEALKNYFASLKIDEVIGNKQGITDSFLNIGIVALKQKQYMEAEYYLIKAKELSITLGAKQILRDVYECLTELDSAKSNFKSAYENHKMYIIYRDSIDNEESKKKTIQSQMTYDFEKKEAATKATQDIKDAVTIEEKQKQKVITYSISGGLLIVLIFAGFIFRSLRVTRKQKNSIEEQKGVVEHQKHIVDEKQKEILDSITYAKRLQKAILPRRSEILQHLPESFVLYKPKDIVAGDFYWMETTPSPSGRAGERYIFIAAADCTGHGVPGAMVSLVCSNALNRTVNEMGIFETGKILDKVRELVLEAFKKSGDEIKDGMDISLLRITTPSPLGIAGVGLQWSGANNPLWYIEQIPPAKGGVTDGALQGDFLLQEIKADKQPIGKTDNPKPFTTHNISSPVYPEPVEGGSSGGASFYLFTDGYADQFSPNGKKMTKKKFKDLVIATQGKSMSEQKQVVNDYFENWKGNTEQVDDVLIIGIHI